MTRLVLSIAMLIVFCGGIIAQADADAAEQKLGLPVKKQNLVEVLKAKKIKENIILIVVERNGVAFELTPSIERELKAARATPTLIAAVRENFRLSVGVTNGKAVNLAKPEYPKAARAAKASGAVNVLVTIDKNGQVIDASALDGHPLLKQSAEQAALASQFSPFTLSGQPVKVSGVITYNFIGN